ncbi:probable choline kinase 1 [Diospyros lotus]|uniref:probable choline kinase 1 n=1 Tax=Diospyros lotus TaxID=55363 RepID=UPI00225A74C8|nr:probable choline kinase 1 [Diospyros lotus]
MAVKENGLEELPPPLQNLLRSLASNWGHLIDTSRLEVVRLSGAMTNEIYRISWPNSEMANENDTKTVLVRCYGKGVEIFFNRDEEIRTFECISEHGQGPRLLGRVPEGRVEEFIHAKTLSAGDIRDPEISGLIAAKLREFHNLDMPGPKRVFLWDRMRKWLSEARRLCSPEQAKEFGLDNLEEEIRMLERDLSRDYQEVGFCHNDLQYGNILIDEETRSITIIDYEYASYNPVAYDLANHFCEMAANYHTDTPHVLNYNLYPSPEDRRRFVRLYLSSAGKLPRDTEVERLVDDAEKYTLANHLFWGLWGLISGNVNDIEFDYMEYARQRFQQYWLGKPKLLGS